MSSATTVSTDRRPPLPQPTTDVSEPTPRRLELARLRALAQLMVALDATIVSIALPSARAAVHATDADRQWVITAYTFLFGGLLLLGGRFADFSGRKGTFLVGLSGFALASAMGGSAPNLAILVGARPVLPRRPGGSTRRFSLLLNAAVLWTTRYMDTALANLRRTGYPVREEDVARLSQLGFKHMNFLGRYAFTLRGPDSCDHCALPPRCRRGGGRVGRAVPKLPPASNGACVPLQQCIGGDLAK
jgi:hypothetical protein